MKQVLCIAFVLVVGLLIVAFLDWVGGLVSAFGSLMSLGGKV